MALGTADVLQGNIVTFTDQLFLDEVRSALQPGLEPKTLDERSRAIGSQFLVSALMAFDSLDEITGQTTIEAGVHQGT